MQDRYSNIMKEYRHEYANKARVTSRHILVIDDDFAIIRDFEPSTFNEDVWQDMCKEAN